ncbi:hypothetical protein PHLH8_22930 [Pseudomonas sp. Pc102]|uniref:hypothetical protein n=1 Tax=Pseudomonas sp. Pc102 TaxID=2678261 RepID=UPI001BCDB52B|nr:hypothetical protein [Pseudomonas sp. Pc102]BBP82651.1 hypothetical protein PHLH8_22930 [Pseudomonas sp. Pc102]
MNLKNKVVLGASLALLLIQVQQTAMAADWWVIFGTGDQPNRDLFYADGASVTEVKMESGQAEPARSVTVVQIFETADAPDFVAYDLQFQCKKRLLKVNAVTAYNRSATASSLPAPQGWKPVPQSWVDRSYDFACKPDERESNAMMRLGNTTADVLATVTRTKMWGITRPSANEENHGPNAVKNSSQGVLRDLDLLLGNKPANQ